MCVCVPPPCLKNGSSRLLWPLAVGITVAHPVVAPAAPGHRRGVSASAPVTPSKGFLERPLERDRCGWKGLETRVCRGSGHSHVNPGRWHPVSTRLFAAPSCCPYK